MSKKSSKQRISLLDWFTNPKMNIVKAAYNGLIAPKVDEYGIDQVRKALYDHVRPNGYHDGVKRVSEAMNNIGVEPKGDKRWSRRDDIWAEYLQVPQDQRHDVEEYVPKVQPAVYRPTKGNPNTNYKRLSIEDIYKEELINSAFGNVISNEPDSPDRTVLNLGENKTSTALGYLLGEHTVGRGKDDKGEYVSYYDNWDLAPTGDVNTEDQSLGLGKPIEFYDRIYLDDYYDVPKEHRGGYYGPEVIVRYDKFAREPLDAYPDFDSKVKGRKNKRYDLGSTTEDTLYK